MAVLYASTKINDFRTFTDSTICSQHGDKQMQNAMPASRRAATDNTQYRKMVIVLSGGGAAAHTEDARIIQPHKTE